VTGDQWGHQWCERIEVGGQVDVHVGEHLGVRRRPHRAQRPPAALLLQPHDAHVAELGGQFGRDTRGVVDAGVVGDGDAGRERELFGEMPMEATDRIDKCQLLVVHRNDHVEHR
jgi:hypothetical protein